MPQILLIRPSEIPQFTPMGGNVDIDKYLPCIYDVQVTVIEPLLGNELYEKIRTDFNNNQLAGNYEILYNDYLKPILRHQVFAEYVEVGAYTVGNSGIFKHVPENSEAVSKADVMYMAQTQRSKAQIYIDRAKRWLDKNLLPEYIGTGCGTTNIKLPGGWLL